MATGDHFRNIFGGLSTLADEVPWTENIANVYEHIAWYSSDVLGISKTRYWKMMVSWANEPEMLELPLETRLTALSRRLQATIQANSGSTRYDSRSDSVASPYESLRRSRYFLESYLNHEFDMLMSLASDRYISAFFLNIFGSAWTGNWSTHGNGGRFQNSTFAAMQMDNICFNAQSGVLVANELKLSGAKNSDQILKYALLFRRLVETGLVPGSTSFHLLFIAANDHRPDWNREIELELAAASRSRKVSAANLNAEDVVTLARSMPKSILTWVDLAKFNARWIGTLTPAQEVERNLLRGFNVSLKDKYHLRESLSDLGD